MFVMCHIVIKYVNLLYHLLCDQQLAYPTMPILKPNILNELKYSLASDDEWKYLLRLDDWNANKVWHRMNFSRLCLTENGL